MSQEQEQEEVQVYLQQHAIGALFEDMMAGLLAETPQEPITFLIRHLKEEKDRRSPLETIVRGGETHNYATLCLEGKQPKKSKSDLTVSSMSKILGKSRPLSQSLELSSWSKRTCSEITGSGCLLQKCPQGDMAASSENAATEEFTKAQGGQTVPFPDGSSAALEISVNHSSRGTATTKIYWRKEEGDPLSEEMLSPPVPRRGLPRLREDLDDCWRGDKWQSQVQQKAQHARHLAALLCQELADGEGTICPHKEDTGEVEEEPILVDDWDELWCESLLIPTASLDAAHTMVRLGLCTHCHRRRNRTERMGRTSQSVRISLTDRMTYAIATNKELKKSAPEPPALPPSHPEPKGEGLAWLGRATATPACKDLTWVTGAPAKPVVSQPSRSSTKDPLLHVPKDVTSHVYRICTPCPVQITTLWFLLMTPTFRLILLKTYLLFIRNAEKIAMYKRTQHKDETSKVEFVPGRTMDDVNRTLIEVGVLEERSEYLYITTKHGQALLQQQQNRLSQLSVALQRLHSRLVSINELLFGRNINTNQALRVLHERLRNLSQEVQAAERNQQGLAHEFSSQLRLVTNMMEDLRTASLEQTSKHHSTALAGLSGPKGGKGEPGDFGLNGWTGSKGENGETGDSGRIGIPGTRGPVGKPGDIGLRGMIGREGDKGFPNKASSL